MEARNFSVQETNIIDRHLPSNAKLSRSADGTIIVEVEDLDGSCHVGWFGRSTMTTYHDGKPETFHMDPDEAFMRHYGISFADALALQEVHRLMGEGSP